LPISKDIHQVSETKYRNMLMPFGNGKLIGLVTKDITLKELPYRRSGEMSR